MGEITRIYDFIDDGFHVAYGDQVDAELNQIIAELNGQLDDSNIKDTAGIKGTKLASAPNGIPAGKYNAKSIARADVEDALVGEVQLDYTSAKIVHGGAVGLEVARGISPSGGQVISATSSEVINITYATDAIDGDPGFSTNVAVVYSVYISAGDPDGVYKNIMTATSLSAFSVKVYNDGALPVTVFVYWIALGI